jgi:hypothetical protein
MHGATHIKIVDNLPRLLTGSQTVKWKTNYLTVRVLLTLHNFFFLFLIPNYIRTSPFSDTDTRLIYVQLTDLIEVG